MINKYLNILNLLGRKHKNIKIYKKILKRFNRHKRNIFYGIGPWAGIMKESKRMVLDEKDKKIMKILENFGYTRPEASIMLYFFFFESGTSRDIEHSTNLRQPEVSQGIKKFIDCKYLDYIETHGDTTRGRPIKKYERLKNKKEIFDDIKNDITKKLKKYEENLKELKKLIEGNYG